MKSGQRRHRRPEEIVEILELLERSGLSQSAFSKREGIGLSTLQSWLRKQREGRLPALLTPAKKRVYSPAKRGHEGRADDAGEFASPARL